MNVSKNVYIRIVKSKLKMGTADKPTTNTPYNNTPSTVKDGVITLASGKTVKMHIVTHEEWERDRIKAYKILIP